MFLNFRSHFISDPTLVTEAGYVQEQISLLERQRPIEVTLLFFETFDKLENAYARKETLCYRKLDFVVTLYDCTK